jgi:ribonuclease Y
MGWHQPRRWRREETPIYEAWSLIFLALSMLVGVMTGRWLETQRSSAIAGSAKERLDRALSEAESIKNRLLSDAESEIRVQRSHLDAESTKRREEIVQNERRLSQREEILEQRTQKLEQQQELIAARQREIDALAAQALLLSESMQKKLAEVAGLNPEQALSEVLRRTEQENQEQINQKIALAENEARLEAESRARQIIVTTIQRWSAKVVQTVTAKSVQLPSEDMKGRIIGREGRNIRLLETLTGVDIIIDDTPEVLTISSFDPVRREVARMALEALIADGRIQPTKIEEVVQECQQRLDVRLTEEGERAALEAKVTGLHPELLKLLGRLYFRTSYSQNVLEHSIEVSALCANMASELGADIEVARRGGLLHDIGKAVTGEIPGPHALVGAELCRKHGESPEVCHAVEAHHEEVPQRSVEVVIVQSCDALSAARPGARREDTAIYMQRIRKLEDLAKSMPGVHACFALQAGREVRVVVNPQDMDDAACAKLSREIANRIQKELTYPGQIRITVLRETRFEETAR